MSQSPRKSRITSSRTLHERERERERKKRERGLQPLPISGDQQVDRQGHCIETVACPLATLVKPFNSRPAADNDAEERGSYAWYSGGFRASNRASTSVCQALSPSTPPLRLADQVVRQQKAHLPGCRWVRWLHPARPPAWKGGAVRRRTRRRRCRRSASESRRPARYSTSSSRV